MSCSDQCQCKSEPTITVTFTETQADTLWYILQGRAERMADCLGARRVAGDIDGSYVTAAAEYENAQELADIVHQALRPAEYLEVPPAEVEMVLPPVFTELATELVTLAESLTRMVGVMADHLEVAGGK